VRRLLVPLALVAVLTACSGEPEAAPAPSSSPPASTEPVPTEPDFTASVVEPEGNFVEFPDGLRVTVVSLQQPDPAVFAAQADGEQPLVLTTHWENVGTAPVELAGYDNVRAALLSGPNGFEADQYAVGGPGTELPVRVAPGSPFDYQVYYSVSDVSALDLVFNPNPDAYADFTFTDVEQLIG
jgi:hypothetical protein